MAFIGKSNIDRKTRKYQEKQGRFLPGTIDFREGVQIYPAIFGKYDEAALSVVYEKIYGVVKEMKKTVPDYLSNQALRQYKRCIFI